MYMYMNVPFLPWALLNLINALQQTFAPSNILIIFDLLFAQIENSIASKEPQHNHLGRTSFTFQQLL